MRKYISLLSLLVMTGCSTLYPYLPSEATVGNTLYATSLASLSVDWFQTRAIVRDPAHHAERNPVLGRHPTYAQVDTYFPAIILGTVISYPFVKPAYRPYLYGAMTLLESVVIIGNFHGGLKMDFVGIKF